MNLGLRYHYDGIKLITDSKLVIDSTTESECNFLAWVKYFETLNENTSLEKSEALKVVTDFAVVTKCDRTPILKYFMKTWINGKYNPDTWNYYDHIGRKTMMLRDLITI
jgi:hypothetical protein